MSNDYRETVLSWGSVRQVVRTERTARMTVAKLEATHTKAVKAALTARKAAAAEARYADTVSAADRVRKDAEARWVKLGFEYSTPEAEGERAVSSLLAGAEDLRAKDLKAAARFPKTGGSYVDCREGFPAVRYTSVDPAALVADMPGVTYEEIDPNAPAPVAEVEQDEPNPYAGMTIADILATFFTPVAA